MKSVNQAADLMRVRAETTLAAMEALNPDSLPWLLSKKQRVQWASLGLGSDGDWSSLLTAWRRNESWAGRSSSIFSFAIVLSSIKKPSLRPRGLKPRVA